MTSVTFFCAVTGVGFNYKGRIKPIEGRCIHPSLYGFNLSYFVNSCRRFLHKRQYNEETAEHLRFLLIYSLWEVGIKEVYLSELNYDTLDEQEIRAELTLSLSIYDSIPSNRFNLTQLKGAKPWLSLSKILKTYGAAAKRIRASDYVEFLQLLFDDNLVELIVQLESLLSKHKNKCVNVLEELDILTILQTFPEDFIQATIYLQKDNVRTKRLVKLMASLRTYKEDTKRI